MNENQEPGFEDFIKLAQRHRERGEYDLAIQYFGKALYLQPGNIRINTDLANTYVLKGDERKDKPESRHFYLQAMEVFNKILSVRPLDEQIHTKRIALAKKLNTLDQLSLEYMEKIKNSPDLNTRAFYEKCQKQIRTLILFEQETAVNRSGYEPSMALKMIFDFMLLPVSMVLLGMSFNKRFKSLFVYSVVLILFYVAYKAFIMYQKRKA